MTSSQANAEVYFTALMALPEKEREAVLVRLTEDEELWEDLMDLRVLEQRKDEPSRPFDDFLAEQGL